MGIRELGSKALNYEAILVAVFAAMSMLKSGILIPTCVIAVLFWPIRKWITGKWSVKTAIDWPILILILLVVISNLVNTPVTIPNDANFRLVVGILLFYALVNSTKSNVDFRRLVIGYLLVGIGLSFFSLFSVTWTTLKLPFIPESIYEFLYVRVVDTVNANVMAGVLIPYLLISTAIFLWSKFNNRIFALLSGISVLSVLSIIILSQSRGAWIAVVIGILIIVTTRWRYGWVGFVLLSFTIIAIILSGSVENFSSQLLGTGILGGFQKRMDVWERAIFIITDFPWTGIGLGWFSKVNTLMYPFKAFDDNSIEHAHNLFLQIAVDLGIIGLISFLAIFLSVITLSLSLIKTWKHSENRLLLSFGTGMIATQAALAIHGVFDAVVWGNIRGVPLLWLIWAGIFSAEKISRNLKRN